MKSGNVFGVANNDFTVSVASEFDVVGVFALTKDASVFAQGDLVYWDDSGKQCTSTVGSNLVIGLAEQAELTGDTTVQVRLTGAPGFSGQASGVKVAHMLYSFAVDGGAVGAITPANSDTIPDNAVVFGGTVNVTTAVTSTAGANVSIGTVAGSGAASILASTAKGSLTLDAILAAAATAAPFKMTAAGKMNITVITTDLTAGVIEAWVLYAPANA
jgi:predicted RecA/RadA family phage recombinase